MRAFCHNGSLHRVAVSEDDVRSFNRRWPGSSLRGLRGVTFAYGRNGDLEDIWYANGNSERWDGAELVALSEDAQAYGEKRCAARSGKSKGGLGCACGLGSAPRMYHIAKREALMLMDWHGGQGSPLYSVGSRAYAGHPVDEATLERAIGELQASQAWQQANRKRLGAQYDRRLPGLIKYLKQKLAVGPLDGLRRR